MHNYSRYKSFLYYGELVITKGQNLAVPSQIFAINSWIGSCNIDLDPAFCGGGRRPRSAVDGGRRQRSAKGRDTAAEGRRRGV